MRRGNRDALQAQPTSPAACRRTDVIGIDAGASTIRLWTRAAGITELATPLTAAEVGNERSDATAAVVDAPAHATVHGRRRLEAATASLNRGAPVLLMEAPLAAAAGADLDITGTSPWVVLDVGVPGSEASVLADGRVIDAVSCPVGCREIERTVLSYLYRRHDVLAGPLAAWRALRSTSGFDIAHDTRTHTRINPDELTADLYRPISAVVGAVRRVSQRASVRMGKEVLDTTNVVVVGGGAFFPPLRAALQEELATAVTAPVDPRHAIIRGLALFAAEAARVPQLWDA